MKWERKITLLVFFCVAPLAGGTTVFGDGFLRQKIRDRIYFREKREIGVTGIWLREKVVGYLGDARKMVPTLGGKIVSAADGWHWATNAPNRPGETAPVGFQDAFYTLCTRLTRCA